MKKVMFIVVLLGFCVGITLGSAADWALIWSDEFDYQGLPDQKKWDYEVGFVRNEEMQYYTRGRLANARVENGFLIIEGRKERYKNPRYKPGSDRWQTQREYAEYTAASLITKHIESWQYGRIEVRAKLPQGKGVWPAIWMLGENHDQVGWPRCGEIDIMEYVGHDPNRVHATTHYSLDGKHASNGGKITTPAPYQAFHVYAIEWNQERIDFYFDDNKYHTFMLNKAGEGEGNPFHQPHYLLINLALGGSWGRQIDDSIFPQKYIIDYVRVFREPQDSKGK